MATSFRILASISCSVLSAVCALAAEGSRISEPKFTGAQSCQSSSCHGGGVGKDQAIIWEKKDVHSRAHAILSASRSTRMAEALGIPDATKSARCTVCHSPFQALPAGRFVKDATRDNGVSCESCHGAAEPWLRFHTRLDTTHAQRVAAGLRELTDFYSRANSCVACHMNIDAELISVGRHPEMFFELDGQTAAQPPHFKDAGTWLGPRAWLTGQAVALRELSWKLSKRADEDLANRFKALVWLMDKTNPSANLAKDGGYSGVQSASDRLARNASTEAWSKEKTSKLLRKLTALSEDLRDPKVTPAEARRRGEVLVMAVDRLWLALKKEGSLTSNTFDDALRVLTELSREQARFDQNKFAASLEQLQVVLERTPGI